MEYYYFKGLIYLQLGKREEAYLSFSTVLNMPYYSNDAAPEDFIKQSYCKMLLLSKLFQLYNGNQALKVSMNMAYLIHFASPATLQDIKQVSMNYTQLVAAIDGTSVDEDFDNEIGVLETKGVNKVDKIVNLHAEKEFVPNGDMPLI